MMFCQTAQKLPHQNAAAFFQRILDEFVEEIKADNALFALAGLYETHLDDQGKAQALYEKLFIEFSNSTLAVEARKKYRLLRGDFDEKSDEDPAQ